MNTLLLGIVALLAVPVLFGFASRTKRSPLTAGAMGLATGYLLGLAAGSAVAAMHWLGPIRIPNPVIVWGGVATTLGNLYAPIFGFAGLIGGVVWGTCGPRRPSQ
jgi:hypothetical protein